MSDKSGDAGFVPFELYMKGHLEHERQIATNSAQIVELFDKIAELKKTADDTNQKVTGHIEKEDQIWAEVQGELGNIKTRIENPTVSLKTIAAFLVSTIPVITAIAYGLHFLNWPH